MAEPGFRVDGTLYPFPDSFTIGDSVLVKMVGGLDMEDFGELLADGAATSDPRALVGMIGVAVWRKNPRWSLERVTRFVQQIDMEKLGFEGADEPAEEEPDDEVDPPSPPKTEPDSGESGSGNEPLTDTSSSSAAGGSNGRQDSGSVEPVPIRSGSPVSPITSRVSSPG